MHDFLNICSLLGFSQDNLDSKRRSTDSCLVSTKQPRLARYLTVIFSQRTVKWSLFYLMPAVIYLIFYTALHSDVEISFHKSS